MAAKVISHLTCPACHKPYKKSDKDNCKYLPCYHSYCEECLVNLSVQSNQQNINITCPECNETSVVPSGGAKQLPNNFFINRLLDEAVLRRKVNGEEKAKCDHCVREDPVEVLCIDCSTFLCNHCYDYHKFSREYQNHGMMPLSELRAKKEDLTIKPKSNFALCPKHEELELNFYCETCDQLVCQYCIVRDHLNHNHDTVKEIAVKHRKELDKIMEPVTMMIEELSLAYDNITIVRNEIGTQANGIDKEIDRYYEELHRQLQQQRDELKNKLHETSRQKKREVTVQLEEIQQTQVQLESVKELNGAMKNGSDQETLLMKKQVVDQMKRLSDSYCKLDTQPVQSASMEFVPVEKYKKSMPQFGHLSHGDVCQMNCEVDLPQHVLVGKVEFRVFTRDRNNHLCHKEGSKIVIQAQPGSGDVIPVEVKDNKDGSYSASFVANEVGEVKLSVTIKGQQIKGSPFNVKVHGKYNTIDKSTKVITNDGKIGEPRGIAFGRGGMWAVTDNLNHCVWIFDRQDQLVRKFGCFGIGSGEFRGPYGIAFDAKNQLYVTDHLNHRVQKFDIFGKYMLQFTSLRSGNSRLKFPLGIVFHDGKLYVTEHSGSRISVFQFDGQFSHVIGLGHLSNPHYTAVSADDQLLVANKGHHCISMFTLDGNYVGKFGTQGTGRGQLSSPSGIATGIHGFIIVTEYGNNRVSIFDKYGVFVHSFGSKGSGQCHFYEPQGIAISPTGDIYICDSYNKRIQVFST